MGGYTTDPRFLLGWEDFELWCRFAARGMQGIRVSNILARYRTGRPSMLAVTNIDTSDEWSALLDRYPFLAGKNDAPRLTTTGGSGTRDYDWQRAGDEWSEAWGSVESQWYGTIYPRVHAFVRGADDSRDRSGPRTLDGVSQGSLSDARRRRSERPLHRRLQAPVREKPALVYHVNDGTVARHAGRFFDRLRACSFDSLVQADRDVLESYVEQLSRKLTPEGVGFFHHSNVGRLHRRRDR